MKGCLIIDEPNKVPDEETLAYFAKILKEHKRRNDIRRKSSAS